MRHHDQDIGRRVAQARREAGMTQEELAEALGVTQRSVQGYEAGKVAPYRHLTRLAEITGRERAWFLSGDRGEGATALDAVGERLVALVERIADEAERIAEIAARLEARLDESDSPRDSAVQP